MRNFNAWYTGTFERNYCEIALQQAAERYVSESEAYDRTVCTGPIINGAIMHATGRERAQINRAAVQLFKRLVATSNGQFTSDDLRREIQRVERRS